MGLVRAIVPGMVLLLLAGCAGEAPLTHGPVVPPPAPVVAPPAMTSVPRCVETVTYSEEGLASWYGKPYDGRPTASGAIFDMNAHSAAHRSLPFGTQLKVTNLRNGRSATVVVNDRGPYRDGRIIDVSRQTAIDLAFLRQGIAPVRITAGTGCR